MQGLKTDDRKIALISPLDCFDNYGLRSLSAYLKSRGIETVMIFLTTYDQIGTSRGWWSFTRQADCTGGDPWNPLSDFNLQDNE